LSVTAEKKNELIEKFGEDPKDSGKTEVQVAILTERINRKSEPLETQTTIAGELNYLSSEDKKSLLEELDHLVRMTVSLCSKVQR